MFEPVKFKGCADDCITIIELMEDLGGFLMEKVVSGDEALLTMLVPSEDIPLMEGLAKDLCKNLARAKVEGAVNKKK